MRIVGDIPHPRMKITVFNYQDKYSIKFERDLIEQIIKFRELSSNLSPSVFISKIPANLIDMIDDNISNIVNQRGQLISKLEDNSSIQFDEII